MEKIYYPYIRQREGFQIIPYNKGNIFAVSFLFLDIVKIHLENNCFEIKWENFKAL